MRMDPDEVKVTEFMRSELVTLEVSTTADVAIEMFEDYGISGAAVLDEAGELCGVVSASDLLPLGGPDESDSTRASVCEGMDAESPVEGPGAPGEAGAPAALVGDWMTPEVLAVGPDATLGEVCDLMDRETIHRVFVTEGKQLRGCVSSTDVVRYVAKHSSAWTGDDADSAWGKAREQR